MPKYDLEEIIHQMQRDYAKYGGFADTLAKLDPFSERFKQTETAALKMVQIQKDYAKYGSFADTLAKLDPLSERFKQTEAAALKMVQIQKDYAKYGSFTDTLAKLDPIFKYFKATDSLALYLKNAQKNLHNVWQLDSIQHHLTQVVTANTNSALISSTFSEVLINQFPYPNRYPEIIEESIAIADKAIDTETSKNANQLNSNSLFLNTIFLSIYILTINAQVPLDQLLVTLAQNLLNSTLFFYLQSNYELSQKSLNGIDRKFFRNARITTQQEFLYTSPHIKHDVIETLEQHKFLEVLDEPNLHKSWLRVRVEIDGQTLEGYVLRRYTSTIK